MGCREPLARGRGTARPSELLVHGSMRRAASVNTSVYKHTDARQTLYHICVCVCFPLIHSEEGKGMLGKDNMEHKSLKLTNTKGPGATELQARGLGCILGGK